MPSKKVFRLSKNSDIPNKIVVNVDVLEQNHKKWEMAKKISID